MSCFGQILVLSYSFTNLNISVSINLYSHILTMDNVSRDGEHAAKDVTIVIRRKIKPGCEKQYDDWLRRFLMLEKNIPGYVGTTIITQGGTDSAIRRQSPYLVNTIMTTILVVGLTYFAMPILSRLLRRWLYPSIEHLQQ